MSRSRGRGVDRAWIPLALAALGAVLSGCGLLDLTPTMPPDRAPTGVAASFAQFEDTIQVSWSPVERAARYRILRADTQGGDYQEIGESSAPIYADPVGMGNRGRLYWYKVEACNSAGCGPRSVAVAGYAGYPPAPTNVRASSGMLNRITVSWDPVPGAMYYQIYRDRFPDGTFAFLGESTTTQYDDTTAVVGTAYWFRVKACTDAGAVGSCSALSSPSRGFRGVMPSASDADKDQTDGQ